MRYLLDSNTCIGWLKQNQPKLLSRIEEETSSNLFLCSVVVAELLYGVERSAIEYQLSNRHRVDLLREELESLPFDDAAAEVYGRLRSYLASKGTPVGPNDLLIASIAIANGLILVTHNMAEFVRIPGLSVEDWQ